MASPKKRGWGLGLFKGGKNNNNDNNADTKPEPEKNQASASQTADDSTQSQTPTNNNPLHPPSPKSVSPQTTSSTSKKAIVPGKSKKNKKSNSKKKKKDDSQQNDSSTATKIREKRRKKVFKKIEWYEEDLQERVSIDGIDSLSKDDVIALGLFNTQRSGKDELSDEELERLLVLADRCKQAKKDETELEVDDEVDMDRTYHLELLSRQRMGEILTDEENEELQYLEQKRQDRTDLLDLEWKKKNGDDDVDEVRLNELSLLDRKRKGDKAMTEEENEELQLLELRREDARINQKDFNEILQLKEKGEDVDEDRFYLLNLLDRKRCKVDISEEENNIVEDYFTLRDDEHFDNIEMTMLLDKRDRGEENSVDAERISELIEILADKEDRELNKVDNDHCSKKDSINDEGDGSAVDDSFNEDEFDELLTRKERGETVDENRLYELELLFRQRQGEDLTEDELMDLDLFQLQRTDDKYSDEISQTEETENVTKEEPQYPLPREGPDLQIDARESEIDISESEEIKEETSDNKDAIDVVDKLTPISTEGSRSMDEKLNVRVDQEVEAIIFDASLAKDNAVSENAVVVETPQTMKIVVVEEEKKNSDTTVHDIFELNMCETESFSKDTGNNSTHSGIDYVGNDIQYNKLVERLQSGESLEEDEEYELELLERIKQGEDLLEDEIEELKWLKQIRDEKTAQPALVVDDSEA